MNVFRQKIGRGKYLVEIAKAIAIAAALSLFNSVVFSSSTSGLTVAATLIANAIFLLVANWLVLVSTVQRLNSVRWSRWLAVLLIVPLINALMVVLLLLKPTTTADSPIDPRSV